MSVDRNLAHVITVLFVKTPKDHSAVIARLVSLGRETSVSVVKCLMFFLIFFYLFCSVKPNAIHASVKCGKKPRVYFDFPVQCFRNG